MTSSRRNPPYGGNVCWLFGPLHTSSRDDSLTLYVTLSDRAAREPPYQARSEPFLLWKPPCLLTSQAQSAFYRQVPFGPRLLALEWAFWTATGHLGFAALAPASAARSPGDLPRARPRRHPLFVDALEGHAPPVDFCNYTIPRTHPRVRQAPDRTQVTRT